MYEQSQNWGEAKTFTFPLLIFFPFNNLSDKVSPHLHKSYLDLLSFKQVSTGKAFTGEQLLQGLQGVGSLSERPYDSIEALYCITGVASIVCKNKFPITVSINNTIKKKKVNILCKKIETFATTPVNVWLAHSNQFKCKINIGILLEPASSQHTDILWEMQSNLSMRSNQTILPKRNESPKTSK